MPAPAIASGPEGAPPPLVFITGASSGIGQALAARYARAGWRLALLARRTALIEDWAQAQGLGPERVCVLGADVAARVLVAPQELPVGVLTAVFGGAYLLLLLWRRGGVA